MRHIFLTLIISVISIVAIAQKQNITSSAIIFKQYNSENDKTKKEAKILEAKNYIDLAYENSSTSNDPKMWMYRAQIYKMIAFNHYNLDHSAIFKATESHLKCMQPHPKKKNKIIIYKRWPEEEVFSGLIQCANKLFNLAVDAYQEGKFKESLEFYDPIHAVIALDSDAQLASIQITSESVIHNSYLSARKMKNNTLSKQLLQNLIDMNAEKPTVYSSMSEIFLEEGDNEKALEYITLGRSLFNDNQDLINYEINLYIQLGKSEELIKKLTAAIQRDSMNTTLYLIRGDVYREKEKNSQALIDYKKALKLDPENFNANYISGILIFNQATIKLNEANATNNNSLHKKLKKESEILYKKALPYLLKAFEIDPKFIDNLSSLKELYYRMGEYEKSEEMKKAIEQLK